MLHNHGWEKQQSLSSKGSRPLLEILLRHEAQRGQAGKETHQKKPCRGSKGPFQMYMAAKKNK